MVALVFISALVVLLQLQVTPALSKKAEEKKGVTLTFVFDSTGSMADELQQVKDGTQAIFKTMYEHPDKPIYNYGLVPFNDPGFGPVTITTDPVAFNNSLKAITVDGGGDCPELAMTGIKLAVEASLPGSYIYVFTDASAKDHHLRPEVETLIQRKHTQVVFVLTGECNGYGDPGYQAYESVATTSSGQVFNVKKDEVKKVLNYVKDSVKERNRVVIVSVDKAEAGKTTFSVPVDATMVVLTVSLSGRDPSITVKDPHGVVKDGDTVLNVPGGLVKKILNPEPGIWVVDSSSSSAHGVRIFSVSDFNFIYGFSVIPTDNMDETAHRPLGGEESSVLVKVTNQTRLSHLTKLLVKDKGHNTLYSLNLTPVPGHSDVYRGGKFTPPTNPFYLEVHGQDKEGNELQRTSLAVVPQPPAPPIVTMPDSLNAVKQSPFDITCHVESLVAFTAYWLKDGVRYGPDEIFKQSSEVKLHIPEVSTDSGGRYTCHAKNLAGESSKTTQLTITAPPPKVQTPDKIRIQPGKNEEITCLVESELPYTVRWIMTHASGSRHEILGSRFEIKPTGNLVINPVQESDEGTYHCIAESAVGKGEDQVRVDVREPVQVSVKPKNKNFIMGTSVTLYCSATGTPEIHLQWKKDGRPIEETDARLQKSVKNTLNLLLENMESSAEGSYECEGNNDVDKDADVANLVYEEFPTATIDESYRRVLRGSTVLLRCTNTGVPKPDISWSVNGRKISSNREYQVLDDGSLKILSVASDGSFKCTATNKLGKAEDSIKVDVGSIPEFVEGPNDTEVEIISNDSILCQMNGDPKPTVNWRRKDGKIIDPARFTYDEDSCALEVSDAQLEDEGTYIVTIENKFGRKENKADIIITGILSPVLEKSSEPITVAVANEFHELSCKVLEGYPPPIITWYKDGELLEEEIDNAKVEMNGSLIIPYATLKNEGSYECEASNIGGKAKKNMKIIVQEPPIFSRPKRSIMKVKKGKDAQLPCMVQGKPKPVVVWKKEGKPLPSSSHFGRSLRHNSLLIKRAKEGHNGTYQCIATNPAGKREKVIDLLVQEPPKITSSDDEVAVFVGDEISLECNVKAFPPAEVIWQKEGLPLSAEGVTFSEDNSVISFMAKAASSGQYKCIATNEVGQDEFVTNVTVMFPPTFDRDSEVVFVNRGEDLTLICYADADPPAEYSWKAPGKELDINHIYSSTLTLHDVQPSDKGVYICDAENYAGDKQKVFYVRVNVPPKIHNTLPKKELLVQGAEYNLPCTADGSPPPKITWKKDGKTISSPHTDEENKLVIRGATLDDSGLYTCTAVNSEGTDHKTFILNVLVPPLMKDTGSSIVEIREGARNVIISCPAIEAMPPPTINWYKDRRYMDTKKGSSRGLPKDGGRSLKMKKIVLADDGVYTCVANNEAGRTSADITIKVLTKPKFNDPKLQVFNEVEDTTIVLDCSVTGIPTPKITWYRNGHHLVDYLIPGLVRSANNEVLEIPKVKARDEGDYSCIAQSKAGQAEKKFKLKVFATMPEFEGFSKPSIDSEWSSWGPWSPCSASCGKSEMVRVRKCLDEAAGCSGNREEWKQCISSACQTDGGWSKWSSWSTCSKTCGSGLRQRSRKCSNPYPIGGRPCEGTNIQREVCNPTPCPINGGWSKWSDWETCSGPCSNSTQRRTRQCSEPSPAFDGADCKGEKMQLIPCTRKGCSVDGSWSYWGPWSPCSASCGPSIRKRSRTCTNPEPQFGGAPCTGESDDVEICPTDLCDDIPLYASIQIKGSINGETFSGKIGHVQVSDHESQRTVEISTKDYLHQSGWFPYLQFILSPVVWSTAFQKEGASNGHNLTQGLFTQTMHIHFDTGEKLVLKHTGEGVGPGDTQQLYVELNGDIPLLPLETTTSMEPFEEDYIQTGPGELFAASSGTVDANGLVINFSWNKIITYSSGKRMPFTVETLSVKDVKDEYNPTSSKLSHKISAAIGKKRSRDECPDGFIFQPDTAYCKDIDECADVRLNKCHVTQTCENHAGSFYCTCPAGLQSTSMGTPCVDINECLAGPGPCSHKCVNTEGSFKCLCPPGNILLDDNLHCSDIFITGVRRANDSEESTDGPIICPPGFMEEGGYCQEKDPCKMGTVLCSIDEVCMNVHGLYRCLALPCPEGYKRNPLTKNCVMKCTEEDSKCDNGAKLTQNIKHVVLTPEISDIPAYWDITLLPVQDEANRTRPNTSFRIKENVEGKPFRVREEHGDGILYSNKLLHGGKDYRVQVEAISYDDSEKEILHTTTFIILIKLSDVTRSPSRR